MRQQFSIAGPQDIRKPLVCSRGSLPDPRAGNDRIALKRGAFVVDFMPDNNPRDFGLLFGGRRGTPVGHGRIMDPAEIDHVVHVSQLVDVSWLYSDLNLVTFG